MEAAFTPLERTNNPSWEIISHSKGDIIKLLKRYEGLLIPFLPKEQLGTAIEELFAVLRYWSDCAKRSLNRAELANQQKC